MSRDDLAEFGRTVSAEEQAFGSDLYDLMAEHGIGKNFTKGSFFGRAYVIMRAIEAIREEQGPVTG